MKLRHIILGVGIAAVALFFTFRNVSLREVLDSIFGLHYQYLPLALACFGITFVLRAYRWHYFCRSLKRIPTGRLYSPLMIGFMGNLLPARAGEFIRAYLLGKRENLSFSASFGTVVVERIFDIFSILFLFEAILLIDANTILKGIHGGGGRLSSFVDSFGAAGLVWATSALILFLTTACYFMTHHQDRIQRFMALFTRIFPIKLQERIHEVFRVFMQGLGILKDPAGILISVVLSAMIWGMIVVANYPMYYCYGIHDQLPASSLITLIVFTCVALLLPTPGYVGPFQFAITFVLAHLYGIEKSTAASFSLVTWFFQMAFIFVVGLFFIIKDNVSFLEISRQAAEQAHHESTQETAKGP
jgi:uncharacterized protein (TIRG00374 family)